MKHRRLEKQLSAYLDNELSPQEREVVEIHFKTCDECQQTLTSFGRNRRWIAALQRPVPPGIWEAVREQMQARSRVPVKKKWTQDVSVLWRQWIHRPFAFGIGAFVAVCLILALSLINPPPDAPEDTFDLLWAVHAADTASNPLTSEVTVIVEVSQPSTPKASFSDDTATFLDLYLGE